MKRRNTKQKQIIQEVVQGVGKHYTAEEALKEVKQYDDSIGLATIYRNLNLMCEEGSIQKIFMDGEYVYDGNPLPHDHFYCECCHNYFDVIEDYDKDLDKKVARKIKGRVSSHMITYRGICQECLEKEEKEKWN